ncbi:MAG TPA: phosphate regulon sensor histidine kinase PhoR [Gammaproteobacteria bacterium]|nr:phosphate regulon sensor histidine kinase PhoR [Gammaproteobacteria bacterium]
MSPWLGELWRVIGLGFIALLVGLAAGHLTAVLFLGLALYLLWHLVQLYRLERWLNGNKRFHPPDAPGIWGDVSQHIYRLQQRNRKRKRKLGKMLNRFQEATEAMPDATVVLDAVGSIEWWNTAAEELLGLHYPRDVGQRLANLIRHPAFAEYLQREDYSDSVVFPLPHNDRRLVSVRVVPYGKNQRLVIARDISRMQQLEQMRRDFVANVSHELRTPLTVVSGYLESLEDDPDCARVHGKSLGAMREQSERMARIVEDLLLLSRLETDEHPEPPAVVRVPGMLDDLCRDARRLSGAHNHQITLEADEGLWLKGHDNELRSAFSNLVFNAVRYTADGGDIRLRWYADEEGAHFEVRDTGIGIARHHIPRLTERFYRVDIGRSRQSGGTGLGLAIVKHVLLRHEGRLDIQSVPGRGSTFRCDFLVGRVLRREESVA